MLCSGLEITVPFESEKNIFRQVEVKFWVVI